MVGRGGLVAASVLGAADPGLDRDPQMFAGGPAAGTGDTLCGNAKIDSNVAMSRLRCFRVPQSCVGRCGRGGSVVVLRP